MGKDPIVIHGTLYDTIDIGALIRAQANTQTGRVDANEVNGKNAPKVKKIDYKKSNQRKK